MLDLLLLVLFVLLLVLYGWMMIELRSFRKWLENRWYSDLSRNGIEEDTDAYRDHGRLDDAA